MRRSRSMGPLESQRAESSPSTSTSKCRVRHVTRLRQFDRRARIDAQKAPQTLYAPANAERGREYGGQGSQSQECSLWSSYRGPPVSCSTSTNGTEARDWSYTKAQMRIRGLHFPTLGNETRSPVPIAILRLENTTPLLADRLPASLSSSPSANAGSSSPQSCPSSLNRLAPRNEARAVAAAPILFTNRSSSRK